MNEFQFLLLLSALCIIQSDGQLVRTAIRMPTESDPVCTPLRFGLLTATCPIQGFQVIYDTIKAKFPEGCMKPYPKELLLAVVTFDQETLMSDPDVQWLFTPTESTTQSQSNRKKREERTEKPSLFGDIDPMGFMDKINSQIHQTFNRLHHTFHHQQLRTNLNQRRKRETFTKEMLASKMCYFLQPRIEDFPTKICSLLELARSLGMIPVDAQYKCNEMGQACSPDGTCQPALKVVFRAVPDAQLAFPEFMKSLAAMTMTDIRQEVLMRFPEANEITSKSDASCKINYGVIDKAADCICTNGTALPCFDVWRAGAAAGGELAAFFEALDTLGEYLLFKDVEMGLLLSSRPIKVLTADDVHFDKDLNVTGPTALVWLHMFGAFDCAKKVQLAGLGQIEPITKPPLMNEQSYNGMGGDNYAGLEDNSFATEEESSYGPQSDKIAKFILRKLLDPTKCGPGGIASVLATVATPEVTDLLLAINPMIVYLKNAFIRKYAVPGTELYEKVNPILNATISKYFPYKYFDDPKLFTFESFSTIVELFCKFSQTIGSCMERKMTEAASSACGKRWPEIKAWLNSMVTGMCTLSDTGLKPNDKTLDLLKQNYGYIFNFMGCGMKEDGTIPDFESGTDPRMINMNLAMHKAFRYCRLEEFSEDLGKKIVMFGDRGSRRPMDIMMVARFLDNTTSTFAAPVRCLTKHMHDFCAINGIDLSVVLKQLLPIISISTFGLVHIPATKADYSRLRAFNSKQRITVMAVGDPHIITYRDNKNYQTCNGLEYFNTEDESDGTHVAEHIDYAGDLGSHDGMNLSSSTMTVSDVGRMKKREAAYSAHQEIVLVANEHFTLSGVLARWSETVNGTFFKQATIKVVEESKFTDTKQPSDSVITYTFEAKSQDTAPQFMRVITTEVLSDTEEPTLDTKTDPITDTTVQISSGNRKILLTIEVKEVKGEKRVVITERNSATAFAFSNPAGDMVNIYVRASTELFEISQGLLVNGCEELVNRTELIQAAKSGARRRRAADCSNSCPSNEYSELCMFDCANAVESSVTGVESMLSTAYDDISTTVSEVVALPSLDEELISAAVVEAAMTEVAATEATPEDKEASGGSDPVEFSSSLTVGDGNSSGSSGDASDSSGDKSPATHAAVSVAVIMLSIISRMF